MGKNFLICLSLANLSFWRSWLYLLYTDSSQYYYLEFPPDAAFACMVVLKVLAFAVICWVAITLVRRFDNPWLLRVAKLVFIAMVAAIVVAMRRVTEVSPTLWLYALWNQIGGVALCVLVAIGFLLCVFVFIQKFSAVVKAAVMLVLILSPFVAVTFVQAGVFVIKDLMTKRSAEVSALNVKGTSIPNELPRRVIWIIFDEMDQRLSFVDRPDYVRLPELDRLRREGLFAQNAYPPYHSTMQSLPALLTGRLVSRAVPVGPDDVEITYLDDGASVSWKDQPNIFSMAEERSLNAAGGGYGHSYCRLFGNILTSCFSHSNSYFEWKGENREDYLLAAALAQILPEAIGDRYIPKRNYLRMLDYAKKVAVDEELNLIFLHFRIPHRPWIYSAEKGKLSIWYDFISYRSGKGYFANLVLADLTLGQIRKVLESAGLWMKTTIIVSSDHSLRLFNNTYDSKFDKRVPFIFKLAGQSEAIVYKPEFNTVVTCDLVLATLDGQLSTVTDVVNWLDEHRNSQPILGAIPEA